MVLLLESYVATCPYLPGGVIPVGSNGENTSVEAAICPTQTSFRSVLVLVCNPAKTIVCPDVGSNTMDWEERGTGPLWDQFGEDPKPAEEKEKRLRRTQQNPTVPRPFIRRPPKMG